MQRIQSMSSSRLSHNACGRIYAFYVCTGRSVALHLVVSTLVTQVLAPSNFLFSFARKGEGKLVLFEEYSTRTALQRIRLDKWINRVTDSLHCSMPENGEKWRENLLHIGVYYFCLLTFLSFTSWSFQHIPVNQKSSHSFTCRIPVRSSTKGMQDKKEKMNKRNIPLLLSNTHNTPHKTPLSLPLCESTA